MNGPMNMKMQFYSFGSLISPRATFQSKLWKAQPRLRHERKFEGTLVILGRNAVFMNKKTIQVYASEI